MQHPIAQSSSSVALIAGACVRGNWLNDQVKNWTVTWQPAERMCNYLLLGFVTRTMVIG